MKITKNTEKLSQIKKAGVILKPNSPEIKVEYEIVKKYFEDEDIEMVLDEKSAAMIHEKSDLSFGDLCNTCDFLVSLGGDGTLISVVRRTFAYDIPVLGINLGTLGFLTDIAFSEIKDFLKVMKKGIYRIESRMMATAICNDKKYVAFNDIVISRKSISTMIKIHAKLDGKPFNTFYGDGVVISTPTGATAYNLSLGGPLVFPLTEAFIVTPIAPHSLTQRPLVLPADFEIEFTVLDKSGAVVIIDGQDIHEINQHETLKIEMAPKKAKLIHKIDRNYFEVLNEKLNWGN